MQTHRILWLAALSALVLCCSAGDICLAENCKACLVPVDQRQSESFLSEYTCQDIPVNECVDGVRCYPERPSCGVCEGCLRPVLKVDGTKEIVDGPGIIVDDGTGFYCDPMVTSSEFCEYKLSGYFCPSCGDCEGCLRPVLGDDFPGDGTKQIIDEADLVCDSKFTSSALCEQVYLGRFCRPTLTCENSSCVGCLRFDDKGLACSPSTTPEDCQEESGVYCPKPTCEEFGCSGCLVVQFGGQVECREAGEEFCLEELEGEYCPRTTPTTTATTTTTTPTTPTTTVTTTTTTTKDPCDHCSLCAIPLEDRLQPLLCQSFPDGACQEKGGILCGVMTTPEVTTTTTTPKPPKRRRCYKTADCKVDGKHGWCTRCHNKHAKQGFCTQRKQIGEHCGHCSVRCVKSAQCTRVSKQYPFPGAAPSSGTRKICCPKMEKVSCPEGTIKIRGKDSMGCPMVTCDTTTTTTTTTAAPTTTTTAPPTTTTAKLRKKSLHCVSFKCVQNCHEVELCGWASNKSKCVKRGVTSKRELTNDRCSEREVATEKAEYCAMCVSTDPLVCSISSQVVEACSNLGCPCGSQY